MTTESAHDHQKVHTFLRHHHMGVLSTASEDGKPWGAAVYFLADTDFNFYFITRSETYKFKNLDKNPYVALTVADPETQTTVQLAGKVSPLPHEDYLEIMFKKFPQIKPKNDLAWQFPIDKLHDGGSYMPLVLVPDRLQYANYQHQKTDPLAGYIEQIIPAK